MEYLHKLNKWFWNEHFWLPPNMTWNDISDTSTVNYAQFSDMNNAFKVALVLLVVRFILERYVFSPIGIYYGLKPKTVSKINYDETENKVLEKAFNENRKIGYKQIQGLAKQLDWSEKRVERWIRRRSLRGKQSKLSKFNECAWKFTYYVCAFSYGLYTLWDKPWFWDTKYCSYGYPHHSVTNDVWWYYMLQLGFYWSLTISQFIDTKRKDFLQMIIHHIVTIPLISFSWTLNFFRFGTLVLMMLDSTDIPLEGAKIAKYLKNQQAANWGFVVFAVAWTVVRLGLFPYRIVYKGMREAFSIMFPAYYVFNSLLYALQILFIAWTWTIVKIALCALASKGSGVKDLRSDSDESDESSSENEANTKGSSSQSNNSS